MGLLILITGTVTSLFPELSFGEVGAWSYVRAGAGVAAGTAFAVWIAMAPSMAYAQERPTVISRPQVAPAQSRQLPLTGLGAAGLLGLGLGSVFSFARLRRDSAKSSRD